MNGAPGYDEVIWLRRAGAGPKPEQLRKLGRRTKLGGRLERSLPERRREWE